MPLPDDADALYALPFPEFVAARTQLEKALRRAGEREAAAAVAKLRKPSAAAWALNQAARHHPDAVEAVLAAAGKVAASRGDQLREASRSLSEAIAELAEAAALEITAAGRLPGPALSGQVKGTLRAAAARPDLADALKRGVLTHDVAPTGLEAFGPTEEEPDARTRARSLLEHATARAAAATAEAQRLAERAGATEHRSRDATEHAAELCRMAEAARAEATTATRAAESAQDDAARAAAALSRLEREA